MPNRQARSRRQEDRGARRVGGRRTPGSGNGWAVKNDVRNDHLSIEYKYTDRKSYPLKFEELKTAERHALLDSGREFAFIIGFGSTLPNAFRAEREYVVVSREYFEYLEGLRDGNPE